MYFLSVERADLLLGLPEAGGRRSIDDGVALEGAARWPLDPCRPPRLHAAAIVRALRPSPVVWACLHRLGPGPLDYDLALYETWRARHGGAGEIFAESVHCFREQEEMHLTSFLFMAIAFRWDVTIRSSLGDEYFEISHEEEIVFEQPTGSVLENFRGKGRSQEIH